MRTETIEVRCTDIEKDTWREMASCCGLPLSGWVRQRLLSPPQSGWMPADAVAPAARTEWTVWRQGWRKPRVAVREFDGWWLKAGDSWELTEEAPTHAHPPIQPPYA